MCKTLSPASRQLTKRMIGAVCIDYQRLIAAPPARWLQNDNEPLLLDSSLVPYCQPGLAADPIYPSVPRPSQARKASRAKNVHQPSQARKAGRAKNVHQPSQACKAGRAEGARRFCGGPSLGRGQGVGHQQRRPLQRPTSPQINNQARRSGYLFVEIVGVEPTTPCLQGRCSSQLSYTPDMRT